MKTQLITDMSFEEYLSLDALNSTGIKLLHAGPLEYWWETYRPRTEDIHTEDIPTKAMRNGTAWHCAVLEGLDTFADNYVAELPLEDWPGALVTQEDLKGWCRDHDLTVGGTKAVLCERISDACEASGEPCPPLWLKMKAEFSAEAERTEREILDRESHENAFAKELQTCHVIDPLRQAGGLPEVTILWEEGGISCKARLDFLAPGIILDLKNVANKHGKPFDRACSDAIANDMMTVQAAWYLRAALAASDAGLLPFDHAGGFVFRWLFLHSGSCPNMAVREYLTESVSLDTGRKIMSAAHQSALAWISQAKDLHRKFMSSHGRDCPWHPRPDVRDMADEDYPAWYLLQD